MIKDAVFSECRRYRYVLYRIWDQNQQYVMFIGLNPSTADEVKDDPTVRRCLGFARDWGYGGLVMTNLFALRATNPKELKRAKNPIGLYANFNGLRTCMNDSYLIENALKAGIIVAAWGNHGNYMNRGETVSRMLKKQHCLGITKKGQPRHPLYVKRIVLPSIFEVLK